VNLAGLLPLIENVPAYRQLVDSIQRGVPEEAFGAWAGQVLSVIQPARPYLVAALYRQL
jgi:hypothetical protein